MLSSMLHSIGVGNMLPSWVKVVCVDINPAVVTKLSDRGSTQTVGIVTDVGLFLHQLATALREWSTPCSRRSSRSRRPDAAHLADPAWVVSTAASISPTPRRARALVRGRHIPGARYAHLDRDLSGEKTGSNGRHPLPTVEQMAERFGALGIAPGTQVVAYDADTGMYAARLWWMLRFMGHDAVAVLDGGFARWTAEGRPTCTAPSDRHHVFEVRRAPTGGLGGRGGRAVWRACWWTRGRPSASAASTRPSTRWAATSPAPATTSSSRT
jgi:rhodanese-related sulfurtransferase